MKLSPKLIAILSCLLAGFSYGLTNNKFALPSLYSACLGVSTQPIDAIAYHPGNRKPPEDFDIASNQILGCSIT